MNRVRSERTALLSHAGSVIAKQSREGGFQGRNFAGLRFGTTPALRASSPDSGGEPRSLLPTLLSDANHVMGV